MQRLISFLLFDDNILIFMKSCKTRLIHMKVFEDWQDLDTKEELLIEEFGAANYKLYQTVKQFSKVSGIQARLPYVLDIK